MHRVPVSALPAIERDIVAAMTREFGLDLRQVLFDATNFFTYINTFNEHSQLAQRGHSKEGRRSLRIIGVALLVTTDFRLPLLHRTYPGNRPDPPTFQSLAADLASRYRELAAGTETVTLVFDKGNNSRQNLDWVERSPFHFIGSLVPTQHPHLLEVSVDRMRSLEANGLPGVRAYRTESEVFGVQRTVLVTWNQRLFDAQCRTLLRETEKRRQHLRVLQRQLRRWRDGKIRGGRKPSLAATQKKVDGWLRARHMRDLFAVQVREVDGLPKVNYRFQRRAWEQLQRRLLGKTLLFTDQAGWSDAELVRGYRAQHHVESAFRQLKDSDCIAIRPQYHWTDQKIAMHVFCCVLALMLCGLLQRELSRHGVKDSIPALLDALRGIREVDVLYPAREEGGEPVLRTTLSRMTDEQRTTYDILGLENLAI
ncbi:MAG: IS1634 family transposase [Candidatus Aminicenantes bacterium]|nr:IS1634 family transposase [Candidatus Aminicenantes bacterium]